MMFVIALGQTCQQNSFIIKFNPSVTDRVRLHRQFTIMFSYCQDKYFLYFLLSTSRVEMSFLTNLFTAHVENVHFYFYSLISRRPRSYFVVYF